MASTAAGAAITPKAIQTSEYELWFGSMCMCMMSLFSVIVRAIYLPIGVKSHLGIFWYEERVAALESQSRFTLKGLISARGTQASTRARLSISLTMAVTMPNCPSPSVIGMNYFTDDSTH